MARYAQILNDTVHWVFEADEPPNFAPDIEIIDITNVTPAPQERWRYSDSVFIDTSPTAEVIKQRKLNTLNQEYFTKMYQIKELYITATLGNSVENAQTIQNELNQSFAALKAELITKQGEIING